MEAEPLELEDGEIVDDEQNDVFGTYNILQRPHVAPVKDATCTNIRYNDESDNSADSESDSDSDSMHTKIKRPKLKLKKHSSMDSSKNDKYKVWCTQMQEESLTEELISFGVTKKLYQERSVESYNFTLHRYPHNGRESHNNNSSDDEKDTEQRFTNKRTNSDRHNIKLRLGKRKNSMDCDNQRGDIRIVADLSTTVDSTDADIATDITTKLSEKKELLIRRVVDIIGKEKAIDFFQKTKKIEESGGMLIMNGSRRRTAGGVYFWLVKNDKHIPQEKIREIFNYDLKETSEQRKRTAANRRQQTEELMKSLESKSEKDLPTLSLLSTRQIAEQARLRRGEGMDRVPLDSDRTVSNPPPSPVTDDPDHSEHPLTERHVQNYADDFLDIGADIDDMEVL